MPRVQEHPFNPKAEVIGRMAVEKLGTGDPGTRDGVFGLGVARAPETCAPPMESQAPVAEAPTMKVPNPDAPISGAAGWQTRVHRASSAP